MVEGVCFESRCAFLYHRFESCRILFIICLACFILSYFINQQSSQKSFHSMELTFFAIRPMLSATDRLVLSKLSYDNAASISFLPRKGNPFRSLGFYNLFALRTSLACYDSAQKFASANSFFLISCLFTGYMMTLQFSRTVISFSLLGFYPVGLCRFFMSVSLTLLLRFFFAALRLKNTTCLL